MMLHPDSMGVFGNLFLTIFISDPSSKCNHGASEMGQRVKMQDTKLNNPSSTPRTHVKVTGDRWHYKVVLWTWHTHVQTYTHTPTHSLTHTYNNNIHTLTHTVMTRTLTQVYNNNIHKQSQHTHSHTYITDTRSHTYSNNPVLSVNCDVKRLFWSWTDFC